MRKFNVTVNGNVYEVEVEELGAGTASNPATPATPKPTSATVAAPKPTSATVSTPKPSAPIPAGLGTITAPMSGTVTKHVAKPGSSVKKGDVVVILEAMKMENDICAACDGVVREIKVGEGTPVQPGDVIAIIG